MELDGRLGRTEERPREDRKTEIDRGGVEGVDGVVKVEPQLLVSIDRTYARSMLTDGVLNCSIMYCESMPCLI